MYKSMKIAIYGNKPRDPERRREVMDTFGIIAQYAAKGVQFLLEERYSTYLKQHGAKSEQFPVFPSQQPPVTDLVISIGGDGTFLRTANSVSSLQTPIVGINSGHLGYLSAATLSDFATVMEHLLAGEFSVEPRSVLSVSSPDSNLHGHTFALNEVAILKQDTASMITVITRLNGIELAECRADGLIISTPTGSTGYNLSVGGPIVAPGAPVWAISPIAAHALTMRPLIVDESARIDISVASRSGSYLLSLDGKSRVLEDNVCLHVEKALWNVNVIHFPGQNFPLTLRTKLLWGIDGI